MASFRGAVGSTAASASLATKGWTADLAAAEERTRRANKVYPTIAGPRYISSGPLSVGFEHRPASSGFAASSVATAACEVEAQRSAAALAEFQKVLAARAAEKAARDAEEATRDAEEAAVELFRGLVAE